MPGKMHWSFMDILCYGMTVLVVAAGVYEIKTHPENKLWILTAMFGWVFFAMTTWEARRAKIALRNMTRRRINEGHHVTD